MGIGLSQGAIELIVHEFGRGDEEKAFRLFERAVTTSVVVAMLLAVCGITGAPAVLRCLGAADSASSCLEPTSS